MTQLIFRVYVDWSQHYEDVFTEMLGCTNAPADV